MENNLETPEIAFSTKVHEIVTKADRLIDVYINTVAQIESIPDELEFPNKSEALELAEQTAETLMELKVMVTGLFEHSAEVNDRIDAALAKFATLKKD